MVGDWPERDVVGAAKLGIRIEVDTNPPAGAILETRLVTRHFPITLRAGEHVRAEHAARLDRVDKVSLLHEAFANFGFGVAVLHLLQRVAALVRRSYQKFAHFRLNNPSSTQV